MSDTAIDENRSTRFTGRQRMTLLVLLGASFMFSVDFSILNVALPAVGAGVGLDSASLAWVASAFALPAAGFALLFGRLADFFGRRRLFILGLVLLAGASLLGGFAANPAMLLTARALQGFATAMALPAALSLITTTFAEGSLRDRVLGLNGALLSAGFTIGALLGGTLVSLLSWRAALFINVPVAVLLLIATPLVIAESIQPTRVKLDLPGALTVTGGLLAVIYAVIEKHLAVGILGAALLVAFWMIELRSSAPLAPVRILTRPTVKWGNFAGLILFVVEPAMIFLMTLYLQQVLSLTPLATGLVFGIPGLASVAAGVIAGRFLARFGNRAVLTVGLSVQALATIPLIFLGTEPSPAVAILVAALFIGFFGHVTAIVAFTVTATTGVPNSEQGLATGLTSMTQQVGITIGVPIMAAVAATQSVQLVGIHFALTVIVAVTLAGVVLIWFGLRPRARAGDRSSARSRQRRGRGSIPAAR